MSLDVTALKIDSPYRRKGPCADYLGMSIPKFDIVRKQDETFPKPVKLPGRILIWDVREIAAWAESKKG